MILKIAQDLFCLEEDEKKPKATMLWIAAICFVRHNTSGIYRLSLMPEPQECLAGISAIVYQPGCPLLHV